MARTVAEKKLDTPTARSRLKRGRQAHWRALHAGVHMGYQRLAGATEGRWLLRRYLGNDKYRVLPLGTADDTQEANGSTVLNTAQAQAKALAMIEKPQGKVHRA